MLVEIPNSARDDFTRAAGVRDTQGRCCTSSVSRQVFHWRCRHCSCWITEAPRVQALRCPCFGSRCGPVPWMNSKSRLLATRSCQREGDKTGQVKAGGRPQSWHIEGWLRCWYSFVYWREGWSFNGARWSRVIGLCSLPLYGSQENYKR